MILESARSNHCHQWKNGTREHRQEKSGSIAIESRLCLDRRTDCSDVTSFLFMAMMCPWCWAVVDDNDLVDAPRACSCQYWQAMHCVPMLPGFCWWQWCANDAGLLLMAMIWWMHQEPNHANVARLCMLPGYAPRSRNSTGELIVPMLPRYRWQWGDNDAGLLLMAMI